jgi:hypothetical protein
MHNIGLWGELSAQRRTIACTAWSNLAVVVE